MEKVTEHFSWNECSCTHKGIKYPCPDELKQNAERVAKNVEALRHALNDKPLDVDSWYRTKEHNDSLPDHAANSRHLIAAAMDLSSRFYPPEFMHSEVESLIKQGEMEEGGLGIYNWGIHYDCDGSHQKRRWDYRR